MKNIRRGAVEFNRSMIDDYMKLPTTMPMIDHWLSTMVERRGLEPYVHWYAWKYIAEFEIWKYLWVEAPIGYMEKYQVHMKALVEDGYQLSQYYKERIL